MRINDFSDTAIDDQRFVLGDLPGILHLRPRTVRLVEQPLAFIEGSGSDRTGNQCDRFLSVGRQRLQRREPYVLSGIVETEEAAELRPVTGRL
jgi:hypothetical protein